MTSTLQGTETTEGDVSYTFRSEGDFPLKENNSKQQMLKNDRFTFSGQNPRMVVGMMTLVLWEKRSR